MRTFATNDNSDIYLGNDRNLAIATDLQAILQTCEHVSRTILGELPYAQSRGIPFFDIALGVTPDAGLYDMYLRKVLLTVSGVTGIGNINIWTDGDAMKYIAEVQTIYGAGVVSGKL